MPNEQQQAKPTFETGLEELEKIVKEMESGDLPLERAISLFETGMALSESCRKQLEEADILVINKADLPQADSVFKQLHIYTDLQRNAGWDVPILKTVAYKDKGIDEVLEAIDKHRAFLGESGRLQEMLRKRGRKQLLATAQSILMERVVHASNGAIDQLAERIAEREIDPRTAAEQLIKEAG